MHINNNINKLCIGICYQDHFILLNAYLISDIYIYMIY